MEFFKLVGRIVIESDEAINGLEDAKREAQEAGQEFEKADSKAKQLSDGFTVLKGAASNLVSEGFRQICSAIGEFISDGYDYYKQIESYATSFEVMTGSEEKAIEMTQKLQEIGASTPFELPQLANTTQLLMNYGFTADEAIESLMMLGDISQGNSEKMGRIATAYGQMSSAGKVSLEDIKQMIEAGFNPLQEISETTGESMESLYARISDGTISIDEITESMIRSTAEGGKYFGSMEQQSATLDGKLSTLKDTANESISNILAPLLQQLADEWLPKVTDAISQVDEKFTAIGNWISNHQGLFATLGVAIGVVTAALTAQAAVQAVQVAMNAAEVTSLSALIAAKVASAAATTAALAPYLLIAAAIAAVIAVVVLCVKHWDEIKAKVAEVANAIAEKVTAMREAVTAKFAEIKETVSNKVNEIATKAKEKFTEMKESMATIMQAAKDTVSEKLTNMKNAFNEHGGGIKGIAAAAMEGVKGYYTAGFTFIDNLTGGKLTEIANKFQSKMDEIKAKVAEAFENIRNSMQQAMEAAKEKVAAIWETIKNVFSDALSVGQKIITDIRSGIENAWAGLKEWFSGLWNSLFGNLNANVNVNSTSTTSTDGSHASGLDYVPFDGYIAELHKGEMVVPAAEASVLRSTGVISMQDERIAALLTSMLEINQEMLNALIAGQTFTVGEREFARLVKQYA